MSGRLLLLALAVFPAFASPEEESKKIASLLRQSSLRQTFSGLDRSSYL
jgi:hypothetical protein